MSPSIILGITAILVIGAIIITGMIVDYKKSKKT